MSNFNTIANKTEGFYKERGSKFHAYTFPVQSDDEALLCIDEVGKAHHKARHVCYAWRIGVHQPQTRTNDDGEPAHTAGDPILNHIKGKGLTNILIVVVRYFGGILLGRGGLVNAYGSAAKDALSRSRIVMKVLKTSIEVSIPYTEMDPLMKFIKGNKLEIRDQKFDNICNFMLQVPEGDADIIRESLDQIPDLKITT